MLSNQRLSMINVKDKVYEYVKRDMLNFGMPNFLGSGGFRNFMHVYVYAPRDGIYLVTYYGVNKCRT
jgi:hypothetical protein